MLAANVDVALVVGSLNRDLNLRRLERFLALAADAEAEAVVVLSKADLDPDPAARALDVRAALGGTVPVLAISVVDGTGLDALGAWLRRPAHRGAARLLGRRQDHAAQPPDRRVAADAAGARGDDRGRHATTHRELVPLAGGALVIDTPGLRLPRVWEQAAGLRTVFADVETLAARCRFRDCSHRGEPGCAVAEAIADGRLAADRLAGMEKLAREEAWLDRRDERAPRRAQAEWKRIHKAQRRAIRPRARGRPHGAPRGSAWLEHANMCS